MFRFPSVLVFIVAVFVTASGYADTVTFQYGVNSYTGVQDTFLESDAPGSHMGTLSPYMYVGYSSSAVMRGLIRFDLSSLTGQYVTITEVKLHLTTGGTSASLSNTLGLYEVASSNAAWGESTATWNTLNGTTAWTGGGGLGTTGYGSLLASAPVNAASSSVEWTISDPTTATNLVNDFVSGANEGFLIKAQNETFSGSDNWIRFVQATSGSPNVSLQVTYSVPEPKAWGLLVSALLALAFHRRRRLADV